MDLIDNFRTFHPNAEEYTFFSSAHGTFSRIDHILGQKWKLSTFKKTETTSRIFFDHYAMRLDINYKKKKKKERKKTVKNTNMKLVISSARCLTPNLQQNRTLTLPTSKWAVQRHIKPTETPKQTTGHDTAI